MDLRLRLGLSAWEERDFGVPSIQTWEETRVWREVKMPDSYLRPGSERNLYFWFKLPGKKTFPWQQASVNPQITRWLTLTRIHGLANKQSAWSWQLHNTESLAWSWRHRATPGTKLLIQDLPWKLHKAAAWSKNTGFPGDRIGTRS